MIFRRMRRAVALAFVLAFCVLRYWLKRLGGPMTLERRALWLQQSARGVLGCLDIEIQFQGEPPVCGLVVANHLSYLDIIIISAVMPCFFVAKMEIDGWPFFGKAARTGGTIFLDRSSLASATAVAEVMTERLQLPVPVLLFPEGTSTDGSQVLRFHSRLIDPATTVGAPITTAAIRYVIGSGVEERELCWYDDQSFISHLWKVLGVEGFSAQLKFGEPKIYPHRRVAADLTHAEIKAWREAGVLETV
ncbi:putative 1-acyl-sn-glycerol-3-phosphate acyltransferase family protein [Candidatus Sulfotelmatomonas gaucii]|uniref:Putative 1-acyl-sn-glycerol-3-phosphate acyltransferase family protein n=1 Tax=Candidatus Sulfuritelmatomonas gaucii TaxID=2043161 RepID=A0A2N9LVC1_9BACT|nr:putative 1-acyl-sn-glycerol-3-phosphate acyltransferase family protein [Candidatus Sulfotelmatomonas gaucii]